MSTPGAPGGDTADRLAIRELVDAWARHADRREPERQAALFTEDGRVTVYMGEPETTEAVQVVTGRAELTAAFEALRSYEATTHFNGQHTATVDGDRATGETYCLAYHLWSSGGQRTLMIMSIRYLDAFIRQDGTWLFAERQLITDWTDRRLSET
jgi:SnoaL-like domain